MRGRWKMVKLGELLTPEQLQQVVKLKDNELRVYLRSQRKELEAKGVDPDYLYYVLIYIVKC